ncbi:hypothetical protein AGMMS49992_08800 [Clostridia bacterium]|nr:hypothetical protein AGMMS49992_08800 [Clostridia bacterium]
MKRMVISLLLVLCLLSMSSLALAAEKPVLRYLGRDATFDLANSPMIPILEELTGYKVEYEALPVGGEGLTKLMLLLSSGTSYDIVNSNTNHFDNALAAHAVTSLEDLLPLAPALLEAVPADSTSWARVQGEDGKTYGIPQLSPTGGPVNAIIVRQDILDALGLATPTTPDELYTVLTAIKAAYPEMIPLTTSDVFDLPAVISAFGSNAGWTHTDGKYVPLQLSPKYREYIAYVRKLYEDGLLDAEFPANDQSTRLSKFSSGKAAMSFFQSSEGPGFYSALAEAVPESKISYLPFLKNADGAAEVQVNIGLEKISFIPRTSANPQAAMDWINQFMLNFKEIYIGPEGVDHEIVNGEYRPIMPAFAVHDTVWWFMPAVVEESVDQWWKARVRKSAEVERGYMDTFQVKAQKGLSISNDPLAMAQPNEELAKLSTVAGSNWINEMVKIVTGAIPMEAYETAVDNWKADGGDRITEIVNELLKD